MSDLDWADDLEISVMATDEHGVITYMNAFAERANQDAGGAKLIGASLFACHPERSLARVHELYQAPGPSHYTVARSGRRKIIHHLPRYRDGRFAGVVEISVPIPAELPHFERRPAGPLG